MKDKNNSPLFDLIKALFSNKGYVYNITNETAKQNIFMVLRRIAIQYPLEANIFNDSKINALETIKFLSDFLFCGYVPKWVFLSIKQKDKTTKKEIAQEDIKLYKNHYNINDKDFDASMKFFKKELINEIKEIRDLYKNIKPNYNEE